MTVMGYMVEWIIGHPVAAGALVYGAFVAGAVMALLWPRQPRGRY